MIEAITMTDEKPKTDTRVVTLRMPIRLYERLAALAEKDRRSLNAEVLVILDEQMAEREKGQRQ
jgi:hypothetical protein